MGKHCAAIGCSNSTKKLKRKQRKEGVTFHSFPHKHPDVLRQWVHELRRPGFIPTPNSFVCSEHFVEDDFAYQPFTGMRMIKRSAVPSKFFFATANETLERSCTAYEFDDEAMNLSLKQETNMGEFSSNFPHDISKAQGPLELDASSRDINKDFCIKTENLIEDHVLTEASSGNRQDIIKTANLTKGQVKTNDNLPCVPLVSDTCQYGKLDTDHSSTETYLPIKIKWESSSETDSTVPYNPIVKAENLLKASDEKTHTHVPSGIGTTCHVTNKNCKSLDTSPKPCSNSNVPSNCITQQHRMDVKSENSTCTGTAEDNLKTGFSMRNTLTRENVKIEQIECKGDDVKEEGLALGQSKQATSLVNGGDQDNGTYFGLKVDSDCDVIPHEDPFIEVDIAVQCEDTFPCAKCELTFSTHVSLYYHMYRLHPEGYWRLRREICQVSSHTGEGEDTTGTVKDTAMGELKRELSATEDENKSNQTWHKCTVCGKGFSLKKNLSRHMEIHGEKTYTCAECGKAYYHSADLKLHARNHNGDENNNGECERSFPCEVCGNELPNVHDLQEHKKIHSGEKSYKCSVCGKAFVRNSYLQRHMRSHNREKPFTCAVCGRGFRHINSLRTHEVKIHTEPKVCTCYVCGIEFMRRDDLQNHIKIHIGEHPYKCNLCSEGFSKEESLKRHIKIHNGEKPFSCEVCGRGFTKAGNLRQHVQIHREDKPHECSVCDKAFNRNSCLQRHMRIHNREREFGCPVCGKGFKNKGDLKKHMKVYNGEKIYKCAVCDKRFSKYDCLQTHLRSHNIEKPPCIQSVVVIQA